MIIQAQDTTTGFYNNSLRGAATGVTNWGFQLVDLNPGTNFVRADDNSLIASGVVYLDDPNAIVSIGPDLLPDSFGKLDESRLVVNDSLYTVQSFDGSALAANRVYWVTVRLKCRIVKLNTKDWMAI